MTDEILNKRGYVYKMCFHSDLKNQQWNYEIRPMVPTAMDYGGKYAKRNQQQRKKIAENVLEDEIEKKRDRGCHLQLRDSEM